MEAFHADRGAQSVFLAEVITRAVTAARIPRVSGPYDISFETRRHIASDSDS